MAGDGFREQMDSRSCTSVTRNDGRVAGRWSSSPAVTPDIFNRESRLLWPWLLRRTDGWGWMPRWDVLSLSHLGGAGMTEGRRREGRVLPRRHARHPPPPSCPTFLIGHPSSSWTRPDGFRIQDVRNDGGEGLSGWLGMDSADERPYCRLTSGARNDGGEHMRGGWIPRSGTASCLCAAGAGNDGMSRVVSKIFGDL